MTSYDATVTRDGKWWMVAIPAIDGLTQARRLAEAEQMAREYLALHLNLPLDEVQIALTVDDVNEINVATALAEIAEERQTAAALEAHARVNAERLAKRLAAEKIPVRDIGTMMGISFQRAHQLVIAHER
ncbi:hypothetical protein BH09ACT4_BH09ACT4_06890 [soil metagenome]